MSNAQTNNNSDGSGCFVVVLIGIILVFHFGKSCFQAKPVASLPPLRAPVAVHQPTMFDRVESSPRHPSPEEPRTPERVTMMCGRCGGRGEIKRMCYRCGGDGTLDERPNSSAYAPLQRCHNCSGSGSITDPCPASCNNGYITRTY
ncbi:MAG: hypothetical protein U0941_06320 [Planctomycetaceae bacterium]